MSMLLHNWRATATWKEHQLAWIFQTPWSNILMLNYKKSIRMWGKVFQQDHKETFLWGEHKANLKCIVKVQRYHGSLSWAKAYPSPTAFPNTTITRWYWIGCPVNVWESLVMTCYASNLKLIQTCLAKNNSYYSFRSTFVLTLSSK
jgi:hypothetical protein